MAKLGPLPLAVLTMLTLIMLTLVASCTSQSPPSARAAPTDSPGAADFGAPGPFATTTRTVTVGSTATYDVFFPRSYAHLGFSSPIVTWGSGTLAIPTMYSTLLRHFASYGFTVIATTLTNTGSGREIAAAVHYLVKMDAKRGSVFGGHLNVHWVAAVGHSQGATGAARVAIMDPTLISTLMTFSLPEARWAATNPDCPVVTDCEEDMAMVHQPTFLISTHGPLDSIIASPEAERAYFSEVKGRAALGIIATSGGVAADHNSVQNAAHGGHPQGELGYATAWLEYVLRGSRRAAAIFSGPSPQLVSNANWPESEVKS